MRENYNKELNRVNIKKIIFGENKTEKDFDGFDNNKGKLSKMKNDKSFDNIYNRNKNPIAIEKKNKSNYIILDDLSLNKNDNSFLNNNKHFQNLDMNIEQEIINNNLDENKTITNEKIKRNKFDFKIKRKSTYTINRNKNRNLFYKSGKNQYNYINFPNYNSN